jgi:penicillin-binding protein 1C
MRRRWIAPALLLAAILAADRIFPPDLSRYKNLSLAVQARDGSILDVLTSKDGYWRLPANSNEVSPNFIHLLIVTEDKRFWYHPGIDPIAMARACLQLATHGRVVSGGSTLTMQLARLLTPHEHNLAGKLFDMARALQLEAHFSKQQILAMYLTLAPYGGNIEGIRAASLIYFQKEPENLTNAEAALLVALPRSPARLRPDRHPLAALAATKHVLVLATLSPDFPTTDLPMLARHKLPQLAPHLAERLQALGYTGMVPTTLDAGLQIEVTDFAARELPWLGTDANIAAIGVDDRTREILFYVGGADYFGKNGMVDMVRARRSPGSALKPFIYGIALDDALIVPGTLMQDAPQNIGGYAPNDFDQSFHGLVTARQALQQSFNLPAVQLLRAIGPARFVATLRATGAIITLPVGSAPSLPVALGGVGINMQDLAMLYCGLANGGDAAPLNFLPMRNAPTAKPEMTQAAAAQIGDMLRGAPLPAGMAPDQAHDIAYKTGTSYGFRDAWAAGFSGDYTVVVWTGRVDGTPSPGAYGRATAAPLLFKIFAMLPSDINTPAPLPTVVPLAMLAPSLQVFSPPYARQVLPTSKQPRILFPPAGAILQVTDPADSPTPISLEATGGAPPYRWMINDTPLPTPPMGITMSWTPAGPGFAHIAVIDKNDAAISEDIELK